VIPVLLTRPFRGVSRDPEEWLAQARSYNEVTLRVAAEQDAACVDVERALRDAPDLFVDDSHLQPRGYQRMARLLLQHLARLEILDTDFVHPGHLDLGLAPEMAEGLGDGLWAAEAWGGSRGRWTRGEASVLLERRSREPGLLVDVSFQRPRGPTTGRIEVNGRTLRSFSEANGRSCFRLDIRAVPERVVQVRFVVEDPFVPALASPAERDRRALGMFLHWVGLVQGASPLPPHDPRFLCASALGLGELEDERPELASGFWPREVWPDGSGRWTGAEATALLDRRGAEGTLLLDLSLQSPRGASRARIEANGEPLLELEGPNRRVRRWLDVRRVPGQRVAVRFIVDSAFVPRDEEPGNPDARQLGLFVRSLRLSDAPDAPP
jgi:hypothetical protein